jgi:hypothetical protein
VDADLHDRFITEIERMSPPGLKRYQNIVGGLIIERVLRTLTLRELKWLYANIERKRKNSSVSAPGANDGKSTESGSIGGINIDLSIE